MDLKLISSNSENSIGCYYQKGETPIVDDNFSLLGYKEGIPVLKSNMVPSEPNETIKVIKKQSPNINISNVLGKKFIQINLQNLKPVNQDSIPEQIKQNFKKKFKITRLKRNVLNSPPQSSVCLISNNVTTPTDQQQFQLVNNKTSTTTASQQDNFIDMQGLKKITMITKTGKVIHSSTDALHWVGSVKPTTASQVWNVDNDFVDDNETLLPIKITKTERLLNARNLDILNKMQALNLSVKKEKRREEHSLKYGGEKITAEKEIQTNMEVKKSFRNEKVQTDPFPYIHLLDDISLDEWDNKNSPLLADANFGISPQWIPQITTSVMVKKDNKAAVSDDYINEKKLIFYNDLQNCIKYNAQGNLPIHEGVINNDLLLVKRQCSALRARKEDINLENHNGCSPLQLAIINDANIEIVKTLLDRGADINDADGEGNNMLHLGVKFRRYEILETILQHKVSSMYGDELVNGFNFDGLTPLMVCCIASWTKGAILFINHRAKVNLRDQTSGKTALFHAAEAQNLDIVRILLNHGADPKIKNFFGTSPHDAMYELEDMSEDIRSLIFGRSKKRSIEAEMNPTRTAKAVKKLKTVSKLQRIETTNGSNGLSTIPFKMRPQID